MEIRIGTVDISMNKSLQKSVLPVAHEVNSQSTETSRISQENLIVNLRSKNEVSTPQATESRKPGDLTRRIQENAKKWRTYWDDGDDDKPPPIVRSNKGFFGGMPFHR